MANFHHLQGGEHELRERFHASYHDILTLDYKASCHHAFFSFLTLSYLAVCLRDFFLLFTKSPFVLNLIALTHSLPLVASSHHYFSCHEACYQLS
jgi:hypothetical protein